MSRTNCAAESSPVDGDRAPALRDFLELGKARLSSLVLLSTIGGFMLASNAPVDLFRLLVTLVGTGLAALGANAFNQIIETPRDRLMHRTRNRPLPAGRLSRRQASVFAVACSVAGPGILALLANPLAGGLAAGCLLIYVLIYTPMKVHSTMNTLVGGVSGAIPPMIGWAAASGELGAGAWLLAAILLVWQMPHFLALAWLYREDYERGGFRMLPQVDPSGLLTFRAVLLFSLALVPAGLMLTVAGETGVLFAVGSLGLGLAAVWLGLRLYRDRTTTEARRVFLGSVIYLPLLLGLMMADRAPSGGPMAAAIVASAQNR
ncbi:MAG: protoheme IX farnesyltransferase [Planctomycetes bacterium]|nr:protoheme IX farnesyltransferase [Planctomycetota bacterium]